MLERSLLASNPVVECSWRVTQQGADGGNRQRVLQGEAAAPLDLKTDGSQSDVGKEFTISV